MRQVDTKALERFATPIIEGLGYELVDLEWKAEAGSMVLRLFIDFPEDKGAHISHEDCARASRAIGTELDVADLIPCAFNLEVSSPGLSRPLKREADFRRFIGRKARIRTRAPLSGTVTEKSPSGRRNFAGPLLSAEGGRVRMDVDGQIFEIPVDEVEKANLVFEF